MKNGIGFVTFSNRFHNHWQDRSIWHHKVLSASSYPFEVRFPRNRFFMPQGFGVSFLHHAPSVHKSSAITLEIIVIVKYDVLEKHIMSAISSIITKLF